MSKYSLLSQLDEKAKQEAAKDPNAPNITYQRYDLDIDKKEIGVLIPIRECDNFEARLMETEKLTNHNLKLIVREFRGLFARD